MTETNTQPDYTSMFTTVRHLQPSLIFASKVGALASKASYGTAMLGVIMLSVVMPSVVAPIPEPQKVVPPKIIIKFVH